MLSDAKFMIFNAKFGIFDAFFMIFADSNTKFSIKCYIIVNTCRIISVLSFISIISIIIIILPCKKKGHYKQIN